MKYVKVMFGTTSGASKDVVYEIGKVNIANNWNPKENNPNDFGGFNFSTEDKIIRWLVRGDTIYDVELPSDAEVVDVESIATPHGIFRTNKIILKNPRPVTDEMAMELYKKSNIPEKSYFKAMAGCTVRGYLKTAKQIIKDKVNTDNIDIALQEFEDFCTIDDKGFNKEKLVNDCKTIYLMLEKIKQEYQSME